MQWLRSLFKHKHSWATTAWNSYSIGVEQKCDCGAYRHHFIQDLPELFGGEMSWRDGEHPIARGMREKQ